jgi:hypothetical protein
MAYPVPKIRKEAAFIAYHLHWPLSEILALPHRERLAWISQVSEINRRILESDQ